MLPRLQAGSEQGYLKGIDGNSYESKLNFARQK